MRSGEDLPHIVRHVLIHEIGHHFGLSDDDMEAIEAKAKEESRGRPARGLTLGARHSSGAISLASTKTATGVGAPRAITP